jgi:hypothetical protein
LFVAAQQPNSASQFIHYTSPRLRRDAKTDMQHIINQFGILINGLTNARRREALELGKALAQATEAAEAAEAEAQATRQALAQQTTEMAQKDALLAQYRSRLGIGE